MNVSWNDQQSKSPLYFNLIDVGESFKINSSRSKGAVYTKVRYRGSYNTVEEYMMEIATGKLFKPTDKEVERVNVDVHIDQNKPTISGY